MSSAHGAQRPWGLEPRGDELDVSGSQQGQEQNGKGRRHGGEAGVAQEVGRHSGPRLAGVVGVVEQPHRPKDPDQDQAQVQADKVTPAEQPENTKLF